MRALLVDIETTPNLVYTWGLFNQNISVSQIVMPSTILCWRAKWLGEKEMLGADRRGGHKKMIKAIHTLFNEADAIIGYNSQSFDERRLNFEFKKAGLKPTKPHTSVDLYRAIAKKFDPTSGKLEFIGPELGWGKKMKHPGMDMWVGCMNGDRKMWKKMLKYNAQDVRVLEAGYKDLLPWLDVHPNLGLWEAGDVPVCPKCASKNIIRRGFYKLKSGIYKQFTCKKCGYWPHETRQIPGSKRPTLK